MAKASDFPAVFARLRSILAPYASSLVVALDTRDNYYLNSTVLMRNKKQILFAGVSIGKAYVSFHLMPVYGSPDLVAAISPDLRKRMQGKACFNFTVVDEELFEELAKLTKKGFAGFKAMKYL